MSVGWRWNSGGGYETQKRSPPRRCCDERNGFYFFVTTTTLLLLRYYSASNAFSNDRSCTCDFFDFQRRSYRSPSRTRLTYMEFVNIKRHFKKMRDLAKWISTEVSCLHEVSVCDVFVRPNSIPRHGLSTFRAISPRVYRPVCKGNPSLLQDRACRQSWTPPRWPLTFSPDSGQNSQPALTLTGSLTHRDQEPGRFEV